MTAGRRPFSIKRVLFGIVATLLGFGLLEGIARLLETAYPVHLSPLVRFGPSDLFLWEHDPDLGYRMRVGSRGVYHSRVGPVMPYAINSKGCRGVEPRSTSPDILFLGDSNTFGEGVNAESEVYTGVLETRVEEAIGRDIELFIGGVPGYSTRTARRWLERDLSHLTPRVAVLWLGWNDRWWAPDGKGQIRRERMPEPVHEALENLALYRVGGLLLRPLARRVLDRGETRSWKPTVPPEETRANLEEMVRRLKARGARVILLTSVNGARTLGDVPSWMIGTDVPDARTFLDLHPLYANVVREVARSEGVDLVDLDEVLGQMPPDELFGNRRHDPVHLNTRAHALIGELLAPRVIETLSAPRDSG